MYRLFPEIIHLHNEHNPSFYGQAPEPIHKNLMEFSNLIKNAGDIDCGLVTDGDADRIGLYDNKGNFVDSHHIILLLIHYLKKYKGMDGKVATAFSSTVKIKNMCDHYNLPLDVVKIGFKYLCGIMVKEDVLVGGEESGGIAIKGHIPERDGVWMGLVIMEYMAKSGKTVSELIQDVYQLVGSFAVERYDLHLNNDLKNFARPKARSGGVRWRRSRQACQAAETAAASRATSRRGRRRSRCRAAGCGRARTRLRVSGGCARAPGRARLRATCATSP